MNKIFNVRFNSRTGQSVVTSELAKSSGKGKSNTIKSALALSLTALLSSNIGLAINLNGDAAGNVNVMFGEESIAESGYGIGVNNSAKGAINLTLNGTKIDSSKSGVFIDRANIADADGDIVINTTNAQIGVTDGNADAIFVGAKGKGRIYIKTDDKTTLNVKGSGSSFGIAVQTRDEMTGGSITIDNSATINTVSGGNNSGLFIQADHKVNGSIVYINRGQMNIGGGDSHGIHLSLRNIVVGPVRVENHGVIDLNDSASAKGIWVQLHNKNTKIESDSLRIENSGTIQNGQIGILVSGAGQNVANVKDVDNNITLLQGSDIQTKVGIQTDLLGKNSITLYHGAAINAKDTAIILQDVGAAVKSVDVINHGSLTSDADKLIIANATKESYGINVTNSQSGDMTGYMTFEGKSRVNLENEGTWTIQDSLRDSATVTLSDNTGNTIRNTGTMKFNAAKTQIVNNGIFTQSGTMDLTAFTTGSSDVHMDGIFRTAGGSVYLGLYKSDTEQSGIRSDRLYLEQVEKGASSTALLFKNTGLLKDPANGQKILVVDVENKDASAAKAFTSGNDVYIGNSEYFLAQLDDGNWYLSTKLDAAVPGVPPTSIIRPDAGLGMAARESVVSSMTPGLSGNGLSPNGITGSGALRSGLRLNSSGQKSNALWAFSTANHSEGTAQNKQLKFHSDIYTLQVGADRGFNVNEGWLELGGFVYATQAKHTSTNRISGRVAKGDTDGYGFGLYGTYFFTAEDRLSPYIDALAIFGRYKNTNKTRGNDHYNYKSNAFSLTLASGYPVQLSNSVILEPQAQITYVDYKAGEHTDHNGADVKFKTNGNFIYRAGAYLIMNAENEDFQPYAAMNIWYDDTSSSIGYGAGNGYVKSDKRGTFYEAKAGFQAKANKDFVFWGEVNTKVGKHNYRDYGAAIGVKYLW